MEQYLDTGAIKYDEQPQQPGGIPPFLKVLCILTFVGAGIGILAGFYTAFANDFSIRTLEASQNNPFGGFMDYTEYIDRLKKWGVLTGILNALASGLCLAGALMMWKLKKVGFYIYVVGQIIPFIALYGLLGGGPAMGGAFQGFAVLGQIFGILFPVAFIVMYGLNMKHLK